MVMMARLADDVSVTAIPGVDSIEDPQVSQEVQRAKDRGATHVNTLRLHFIPGFLGTEVMIARCE
jgi:hypothetical protein